MNKNTTTWDGLVQTFSESMKALKAMSKTQQELPDSLMINQTKYEASHEIANQLNTFFVASILEIQQTIQLYHYNDYGNRRLMTIFDNFEPTNITEVQSVMSSIKTRAGLDYINIDIMKDSIEIIGPFLVETINDSLNSGYFPKSWRNSVVTPLLKVQGSCEASDLRPINQISMPDKITQHIVRRQLESHVKTNDLISPMQSGFREKFSCETAVNLVINEWKTEIDNGFIVIALFLDLRRAFETVDHTILIKTLEFYGLTGNVVNWFRSWLSNRSQQTMYKGNLSGKVPINVGIPQGTPLSCTLFILYINRLVQRCDRLKIKLFADDTLLWIVTKPEFMNEAVRIFNEELKTVFKYLCMLKLKVNTKKTVLMVIGSKYNIERIDIPIVLDIGGDIIQRVEEIKYLGVIIDQYLSFNSNHKYVCKKLASKTYFLLRNAKKLDTKTKLLYYKSLIYPHFQYCSTVLFLCNNQQIHDLQIMQNRCMRVILNCDYYQSIQSMLDKLELLDVQQIVNYNVLLLIYKATKNMLPKYLCEKLLYVSETQPYNLRNNDKFRLPMYKKTCTQNSVFYNGVKMFNQFSTSVNINSSSLNELKSVLRHYVKTNFSSH